MCCRLTSSILVMFMVAVFISYVLHCFVPIEVVWRYVEPRLDPAASHKYAKTALRIALCVFTCESLTWPHPRLSCLR